MLLNRRKVIAASVMSIRESPKYTGGGKHFERQRCPKNARQPQLNRAHTICPGTSGTVMANVSTFFQIASPRSPTRVSQHSCAATISFFSPRITSIIAHTVGSVSMQILFCEYWAQPGHSLCALRRNDLCSNYPQKNICYGVPGTFI